MGPNCANFAEANRPSGKARTNHTFAMSVDRKISGRLSERLRFASYNQL